MARLGVSLSDEAYALLKDEADARGATISNVVREILEGHFQQKGQKITIKTDQWGGQRTDASSETTSPPDDDEPTIIHTLPKGIEKVDGKYYAIDTDTGERVEIDPEQMWFWTEEWQAKEREADEDFKAGRYQTFESVDAMFASLKQSRQ